MTASRGHLGLLLAACLLTACDGGATTTPAPTSPAPTSIDVGAGPEDNLDLGDRSPVIASSSLGDLTMTWSTTLGDGAMLHLRCIGEATAVVRAGEAADGEVLVDDVACDGRQRDVPLDTDDPLTALTMTAVDGSMTYGAAAITDG